MSGVSRGKQKAFDRFLSAIERAGNKIPEVTMMFIFLALITVIVSWICSLAGVAVIHPGTGDRVEVVNLLSREGLRRIWSNAITNYSGFPPFAMVLVAVIGSGAAEKSGLFAAVMQRFLMGARPVFVTAIIVVIGLLGNTAGDAAVVVLPVLAGAIYLNIGRSPILGIITAICSVLAGFSANILLGMTDVLAYGFTESAARMIDPAYEASPAINYYFLAVSFFILAAVAIFVSEKILAPRFAHIDISKYGKVETAALTPAQLKGLRWAGIAFLATAAVIVLMSVGKNPLLGDENGSILSPASPFMRGIIVAVALLMFVPGWAYGTGSGQYKDKKNRNVFTDVRDAYKDVAGYILLCFFIAQFISFFNWSNLGVAMAVSGAGLLQAANITHAVPLLLGIVLITCIVNIFIGSASAKWALLAPVFIPMMMILGFDPAVTQAAYRIGDSITTPISPLTAYLPLFISYCRKYEPDAGVGTIIANGIPFSIWFAIAWTIQLIIWVLLELPLGPGGFIFLQ